VYSVRVGKLDTETSVGITNMYQRARVQAKNKKAVAAFTSQAQQDIAQYTTETNKPRVGLYTDLSNSLSLAQQTLDQPIYAGYTKYLLICSDMENDPKWKRHAPLKPITLSNTTVLLVRPVLPLERLKALFPASQVYVFTDVNDAITLIK
jgi:hypothetical protein